MPNIKPLRAYDEVDVLNFYKYSGTLPVTKGTIVKIVGSGWHNDNQPVTMLGAPGASYTNTVSQRWGVIPAVASCGTGEAALGMLLYDVREQDENNELLLYRPQKQAEMQCVLSGQAVPIVTKGYFLYSGVEGTPTAGNFAYASGGAITTSSQNAVTASTVGKFLGAKDSRGWTLVKLDL